VPALAHEAQAVNKIKESCRFTAVVGNPPYAYESRNNGAWIGKLVRDYYFMDDEPIKERNPKGLQDDYVKFVRFGQLQISQSSLGILCYVTNHAFLDNPTFRGMRHNMIHDFDQLDFIDLHGSVKKKERTPEGGNDDNVFDIEQGVAISLMARNTSAPRRITVGHLWGARDDKYRRCLQNNNVTIGCTKIVPRYPFYLFQDLNEDAREEYENGWSVVDIFELKSVGMVTSRDGFVLDFDKDVLMGRIVAFINSDKSEEDIKARFLTPTDTLPIRNVQDALRASNNWSKHILPCHYRPFDTRYIMYDDRVVGRSRKKVFKHLLAGNNLAILFRRQYKHGTYSYTLVARHVTEARYMENAYSHVYVNPLYLYPQSKDLFARNAQSVRKENITQAFRCFINDSLGSGIGPEDVLNYIYAILYSPTYRRRYADLLRVDFPRIQVVAGRGLFNYLSRLGGELVSLHLMESPRLDNFITTLVTPNLPANLANAQPCEGFKPSQGFNPETAEFRVEKVSYADETVWLDKAKTTGFRGVPEEVWNFHIGGYQVCEKWLKDRQARGGKNPRPGRVLTQEDLVHYQKIVVALKETIRLMQEIDDVIEQHGGWPGAFVTEKS